MVVVRALDSIKRTGLLSTQEVFENLVQFVIDR